MANIMRVGGGGLKATLLWTNPSPTSAFAFQNVTLSDNWTNYDFVMIEYKKIYTETTTLKTFVDIATLNNTYGDLSFAPIGGTSNGSTVFVRYISKNGRGNIGETILPSNQLGIGNSVAIYAQTSNNIYVIPTKIYGIKGNIGGI